MTAPDPWWRGAAVYQIYPRSFADSDGDGIGDLPGITARLDHVAALGVDAIWLSPFFTSPMADFGYDVSDYRDVDPVFGTLADFAALLARAHALGLKVIIDQVYAHTSDAHPWFAQSRAGRDDPRADWYVWADPRPDGTPPNNWQSVFGGAAWTWDARRRQYYMHNFLRQQPQLNAHRRDVQDALLDVARFWLERGVDGFRLDAINFLLFDPALADNPAAAPGAWPVARPCDYQLPVNNQNHPAIPGFLERLRALTDDHGAFAVAEVGGRGTLPLMKAYTAPGRVQTAYSFAFLQADALTPALVHETLAQWSDDPADGWPSWAFSNHDAPRALTRWSVPPDARDAYARMLLLLLACLRGNIFVYYGDELGLTQADIAFADLRDPEAIANWPETYGRDGARTPMPWRAHASGLGFTTGKPWLPFGRDHAALAVDRIETDPCAPLGLARRALALRRASPVLRSGAMTFVEVGPAVLAFEREHAGERLLCVFNLAGDPARFAPPDAGWRTLLASDESIAERPGWRLPPFSGLVATLG